MDDGKLRVFLEAARCGSLTKAAEHLDYSQSGMTHMMHKLEEELDCPLLERTNRGIRISIQGERLRPYMENVINACDELRRAAEREADKDAHHLKLGSFSSISHAWLPQMLAGFKESYPDIKVDVTIGGMELCDKMYAGDLQVVLMGNLAPIDGEWIPLRKVPLVAVTPLNFPHPAGLPISLSELMDQPFLSCEEQYIDSLLPPGVQRMQVETSDDSTIISLVAEGLGVAVLSALSLEGYEGKIKIIPLEEAYHCTMGVAIRSMKGAEPAAQKFVNYLKENYRSER